jgi:hypothetical protein
MLKFIYAECQKSPFDECRYAESRYAERLSAECRRATY